MKLFPSPSLKLSNYVLSVTGMIGPSRSATAVRVASLLRDVSLPIISYSATSSILSDKNLYPNFFRTAVSDTQQMSVRMALAYFSMKSLIFIVLLWICFNLYVCSYLYAYWIFWYLIFKNISVGNYNINFLTLKTFIIKTLFFQLITDILQQLSWTFVKVVYEDDAYGREAVKELAEKAKAAGICINDTESMTGQTIENIARNLVSNLQVRFTYSCI